MGDSIIKGWGSSDVAGYHWGFNFIGSGGRICHAVVLGTWQQIVVIDHDNRPRSRKIFLQVMGE